MLVKIKFSYNNHLKIIYFIYALDIIFFFKKKIVMNISFSKLIKISILKIINFIKYYDFIEIYILYSFKNQRYQILKNNNFSYFDDNIWFLKDFLTTDSSFF